MSARHRRRSFRRSKIHGYQLFCKGSSGGRPVVSAWRGDRNGRDREDGLWTSEKDWLPYGTYEVAEVQEPDGYLPDGAQARNFQIREDGKIVSLDNNEGAIKNQGKTWRSELCESSRQHPGAAGKCAL